MKKLLYLIAFLGTAAMAQTKPIPDTAITLHTTNNKLYQLVNLVQYSVNKLSDSNIPSNELKELNKQFQEVLQPMLVESRKQVVKVDTSKKVGAK